MGKSYSSDLRKRVVGFVDAGHSRQEAARRFGVSASFAVKLDARRRETGSTEPAVQGRPRGGGKLAPHMDFLIGRVKAQPDITMPELAGELEAQRGVVAASASISRVLRKAGFTYKKSAHGRGAWARRRR
jgi:transposase